MAAASIPELRCRSVLKYPTLAIFSTAWLVVCSSELMHRYCKNKSPHGAIAMAMSGRIAAEYNDAEPRYVQKVLKCVIEEAEIACRGDVNAD